VGQIKTEELRTQIRDVFYNNQLQLPNKAIMTATEVERTYELMQRFLGPTLGRLETELLNPLIERCFAMMLRRNALPAPPEALLGLDPDIDIEYEGPLARAQRASDVQAIERVLATVLPLAQVNPDVVDVLDFDEAVRYIARRNGLPTQVMRSQDAISQIRTARTQARQQQLQAAQATEMIGKAAPLLKAAAPDGIDLAGMVEEG
jgi:hypothetical protein